MCMYVGEIIFVSVIVGRSHIC